MRHEETRMTNASSGLLRTIQEFLQQDLIHKLNPVRKTKGEILYFDKYDDVTPVLFFSTFTRRDQIAI